MPPPLLSPAAALRRLGHGPTQALAVLLLAVLSLGSSGTPRAQSLADPVADENPVADEIGFVRLLFTEEGVTVLDVTTRPGRLKQRRTPQERSVPRGYLAVEVRTAQGVAIWTGLVEDPLLERLEYVNDEGELETRFVTHEQAETTVRIPLATARQTVTFYRSEDGAARTAIADVEVSR